MGPTEPPNNMTTDSPVAPSRPASPSDGGATPVSPVGPPLSTPPSAPDPPLSTPDSPPSPEPPSAGARPSMVAPSLPASVPESGTNPQTPLQAEGATHRQPSKAPQSVIPARIRSLPGGTNRRTKGQPSAPPP